MSISERKKKTPQQRLYGKAYRKGRDNTIKKLTKYIEDNFFEIDSKIICRTGMTKKELINEIKNIYLEK